MNALLPARAPRPSLPLVGALALALGRAHECCGPARHTWAMIVAGALSGPVLWIAPRWLRDRPHPDGIRPFAGPERFLFAAPEHRMDLLWCMEEALRSGAVPLVVADLPAPPGLTPVRRLHLAAEEGAARAFRPPLGLLLTPGEGGAPGVESRWRMAPAHERAAERWRLERLRDRTAPPAAWHLSGRPDAWVLDRA
jgi:protein ImuA